MKIVSNKPLVRFIQGIVCFAASFYCLIWGIELEFQHSDLALLVPPTTPLLFIAGCVRFRQGFAGTPIKPEKWGQAIYAAAFSVLSPQLTGKLRASIGLFWK